MELLFELSIICTEKSLFQYVYDVHYIEFFFFFFFLLLFGSITEK